MTLRNLYYNYTGYPNYYEEGGLVGRPNGVQLIPIETKGISPSDAVNNVNAEGGNKFMDFMNSSGGGWASAIAPAATNITNAFLDTEASTADRVAGAMGIPVLAKQWTADTTKGDKYLKDLALQNTGIKKPNYIQDASSAWGANNAIKLNAQNNISPISPESALPSLKDFKGNWWRNTGAAVTQGAAAGSVGGPWGALGGAVTGLLGSIGGLFGRTGRAQKAYDDFLAKRRTLMSAQQSAFDKAVKDQTLSNMQALANGNTQQRINDMANIRAYGGNLFDDGGDLTDEQQMVLADIQADPRILFTPKYSQWRDYIRRTSPDYLDRLYASLPYEQQRDIYQNDREAWGALSNEAKGNFGGAQVRKKTDEISPYVAGALGLVGAAPAMEAVAMFPMLENGLNAYFGYEGAKNLPTAVTDAYDYAKKGDWSRAGLSAGEAALDGMFIGNGIKGVKNLSELSGLSDRIYNTFPILDPYTTPGATFGYHGTSALDRLLGTISRRNGFTYKPEIPEFHRRLRINEPNDMRFDENGNFILSSGRTGEGHDGIVNFATSEPARGHRSHKTLSGIDDYIVNPEALKNQEFISIEPSDTFFETSELSINPKDITLVSGDTKLLDYAKSKGFNTLSSPRLREYYRKNHAKPTTSGKNSNKLSITKEGADVSPRDVGDEIQRLTSKRGAPTLEDYRFFENETGLPSGVVPIEEYNAVGQQALYGHSPSLRANLNWNNVAYDPATQVESLYRKTKINPDDVEAVKKYNDYIDNLKRINNNTEYAMGGNLYSDGGDINVADLFQNAVQKSAFTSLYDPYTIKRGETLSGIASRNNISLEDLINSNPEITNPSMINVGQQINLPIHYNNKEITDGVSDSLDAPNFLDYTVKQGDYMSKIAKSNNTTLEELQKANPQIKDFNKIFVGDIIHVPQNTTITAPAPKRMSLSERRTFEEEANKTNLGAIQGYRHDNNYAVIDKKNKTVTVYSPTNEVLYQSNEINTGLSGDDYNTITYVDKNGKIKSDEGNMSTPAGITEISGLGTYHNQPSYTRKRVGDETDIASSFHAGNIKKGSNGCVRMSDKTLQDLQQFLNKGTRVYTLPEKDGSKFVLKDGKLSFQADNPYGETDGSKKYWDDYNVYNDKTSGDLFISPNENFKNKYKDTEKLGNAVKFGNTLSENKEELQKYLGLSSGVYNDLAQLAMGIADQETKFGSSTKYSFKSSMPWLVNSAKWITNNNSANSQGITQIKYDADIRNEDLKKIYDDLGITKDSLQTPEGAAKATLARLAFIYKTEVLGKKFTGADDIEVSPLDALLYKYMGKNGELKNHTATPTLNEYIKNVNTYKNNFDYEGTFAMGGNLYTDLSPNMMSLWNNKQQIDQQKVNMQQMNFGLGNSFNQKLNTFDYGGSMNGMDLPTGMQSYENGGTHEENPYGGIQVGVDQQGNPNLVEEGEFRWGDYVFSDRINVDPTLLSRYNLAPATKHQNKKANKGKLSYADMAKKYAKKNGELANDPIGKNTLEAYMKRLQDAQEDQKFQDSMEQQKQDAINQYRKTLSTPQQGNPMYGAMKYNGMGNAATQQGVNAGMSDLGQQSSGNEVLSNTNRSGNNMLHAFGGNLFWNGGTPQIKPKLLNVNPNLVLGDDYMSSWTANNAGTPRLFSSTTPMYTGENPEANFTAYQKRYPTLPSDAKGMQQLLVNEGYDIGNTGQNKDGVDGIWGNKSQAAWYDFLRAYNHRPNTINQYDLIGSNNQPSTSNNQASYNGGLNLGVRDGDATTDANNLGDGQTSYGNAEDNTNIDRSNSTGNTNTGNTTTGTYATNAFKEDREGVPLYSTAGKFATFGKGFTPMLYDWMNKTNTKYDPNQRPANELVDMGNNSTFLRTADTIGGYRAPNLMDAERMNNAAQAQGIAALQAALNVGNGNRAFAANQIQQQGYNTEMSIGNNYATVQQANNDERFKNDSFNTALDQANANIRNSMYQDNQKGQQIGQQMKIDAKKYANDYLQKENWYADRTNRTAMDNRATNQAAWTDNALNYFITQAQENAERNRQNNDITKRYWSDKDGVMHYIGDSGLNSKIREYFRTHGIDNGTFRDDRLAAFNSIIQNNKAKDVADEKGELWSTVQGLMDDEIAARNKEIADAKKNEADELQEYRDQFDSELAQLGRYAANKDIYGNYWTSSGDLDYYGKEGFRDSQSLSQLKRAIEMLRTHNDRYNKWTPQNVTAYGGRINNGNKNNKNGYYTYTY